MADKQPTIYDVAEAAGVSIATVSRVMAGKTASAASQQKVNEAIARLNYHPVSQIRAAENAPSKVFALVVSDIENPYYALLTAGAEREAAASGYALQLYVNDLMRTADEGIISRLLEQRLDGVVLVGSVIENGTQESTADVIQRLMERMPVVTIGPVKCAPKCVNITGDLSLSVRKSLDYLTSLGHRRIAFIGGTRDGRSAMIRESAFRDEMLRRGLTYDDEQQNETGFTPQAGELCVTKLFSRLEGERRPTALIAINDLVALGAMRQLQRMGLRVPEDVSVIGCDNQFFTNYLNPPLTTIELRPSEHGHLAISELVAMSTGSRRYAYTQIQECSLIVRESCAAVPDR